MPKMLLFFIFFMSFLLMILFMFSSMQLHPIMMILMIILYTLSTCFMMSLWQSNPMYSILLFLIMISGMLIIFLYFSSLITNIQNKFSFNFLLLINFFINMIFFLFLMFTNSSHNSWPLNFYLEILNLSSTLKQDLFNNLFMIYSYPYNNFTFLSMFFLLIALFIIIKMCTIKSASLRKIS